MQNRPSSCDVSIKPANIDCEGNVMPPTNYSKEKPKTTGLEHVPEEKVQAMKDYAVKLKKKFPHMKPDRLKRKVADNLKSNLHEPKENC